MHPRCHPPRRLLYGASMSGIRKTRRGQEALRHHRTKPQPRPIPPGTLHEAVEAERLVCRRKQAAEALGVSISTIDRHVVPTLHAVKTPLPTAHGGR